MAEDPLASVKADLTATSNQISSQLRTLVLGVLAFVWLFLSGAKDMPAEIVCAMPKWELIAIAILCITALIADVLQYLVGYACSGAVLKRFDPQVPGSASFDKSSPLYRARSWLFWTKQALAGMAIAWLLLMLFRAVAA